jgi:serine protease Do
MNPSRSLVAVFAASLLLAFGQHSVARGTLPDFTVLAEQNRTAVVNIGTSQKRQQPPDVEIPDLPEDNPLNEFFRRFFGEEPPGFGGQPPSSLGSGFIISADGYIISNYHVVKDADEIMVRLADRREFIAEIVGYDPKSDIAVLKIKATGLPTVKIGSADKLKVGEWVLAIGSPFGFEYSVTAGIVSAKGRALPNENYTPFIQTDVAINPGNSGGPLFNLDGEVVGVNSQIFSRTGTYMGLSFAIPIDLVMNSYEQIREHGSVTRGWLGVLIQDVTRELAESFGMKKPQGALVSKVLPNSPAEQAGIEVGDIITEFGGYTIDLSSDLPPLVGNTKVDESVPIRVLRAGKTERLEVKIGRLPEDEELQLAVESKSGSTTDKRLNLAVRDPSNDERTKLGLGDHGMIVDKVEAGPAQDAGILAGDVILSINNTKITSNEQFKRIVDGLPAGKSVPILIQRGGNPLFLGLRMPK